MNDKQEMAAGNRHRSKVICKVLDEHYRARDIGYQAALQDLQSDVRHFCDYRNFKFGDIDRRAHQHYRGEKQAS